FWRMDLVSLVITPVVESLLVPVKKHLGFLVSSTKHVKDMEEKMHQLKLSEKDIQNNLDEANEKKYKLPLAVIASTSAGPSTSTPDGTQNNFKSRQLIYNAALKFLQPTNESHKMIALCGMGGVGKTTMMEQLLKEVQALSNVFDRVVKVVIGESTSLIALQRAIAININKEDLKEEAEDARADLLRTIFEGMANQVFLLSGMFPDDFDIRIEDLVRYGWGLKLFTKVHTLREARRRTLVCVNNLIRANLLIESECMGCVKMHDLVRAFALSNFTKVKQASIVNHDNMSGYQPIESYERILLKCTDANCDELEILSRELFALELEFFENKAQPKKVSFEKLERFRISIGCRLVELEDDKKYSFKNTIKCVGDCNELLEINELFEKTEELDLQVNEMNHLENIVSTHHSFSNLKVLHVSDCEELTYLFTVSMVSGLKNLERLKISKCPVMRTLVDEDCTVGVIRFPKLNFMYLKKLQNMVSLCRTVIELPELVELKLRILPNFTSISPDSSNPGGIQSLLNKEVVIPKLEKLEIDGMEKLKQIWPCQIPTVEKNNVSMLRIISIRSCDSLTNIFPDNPLPMLNNLEELTVVWCGSIEVIFNIDFENVSEMEGHVSRLRSIKVEDLKNLTEIWRMRGVNNSNILINGFQGVQSITITDCKRFKDIFTPVTTNFDLRALINYSPIEWNVKSEVDDYTCHHLKHLKLSRDKKVEVVFDMDRQLATIQPQQLLPYLYLESINLARLEEMSHVWKCHNWNKFLIPQHQPLQFPFQNLTDIKLQYCHKIKYLFSPLMAKYLSNLKTVNIYDCNGIEEVISRRDDEHEENTTSTSVYQDTTLFPHLDTLHIKLLENLKSVDDGDTRCRSDQLSSNITNTIHDDFQSGQVISASWSLCQYFRTISVEQCDALSSLIPWYAVGQMKKLQELDIKDCSSMTEVFECESINNVDEGGAPLRNVTIVVPQLSNLKSLSISRCDRLPHIFTFSTVGTLHHLKELKVKNCQAMQVIVKQENGTSSDCVALPLLETLELDDLPNLKGFFLGMNAFRWPSLDKVLIEDCPELMMFTSGQSTTPKLKYIQTSVGKYSPDCGLNYHGTINQTTFPPSDPTISKGMPYTFHNLIEINIKWEDVGKTIFPSHALPQLQKLQQIHLFKCTRVEEVFEVVASEGTNGSGFNESQTVVQIPNLTQVDLRGLWDLKYLWKSNKWMVLEFPNLTTLSIYRCNSLEHVFTCSMVGSLVQLQDLNISGCKNIEVIVKKEEEKECDAKVSDIMLPRLNSLNLKYLPSFKGFCLGKEAFSLPLLETLEIESCSALTVFTNGHVSTPELKVIYTDFELYYVNTDINSFIKTKQEEKLWYSDEDEDEDGEDEDGEEVDEDGEDRDRDGGAKDVCGLKAGAIYSSFAVAEPELVSFFIHLSSW
ncbi:hypothetical protein M8C21_016651, partial [Ambrosia artemisiifolia]